MKYISDDVGFFESKRWDRISKWVGSICGLLFLGLVFKNMDTVLFVLFGIKFPQ